MNASELTFGIEIECNLPGGAGVMVGSYVRGTQVEGLPVGWVAKSDCSVTAARGRYPVEIVSPVLRGEDGMRQVVAAVGRLNEMGARVNASCGFHVHVGWTLGTTGAGRAALDRLVTLTANFEKAIYASTGTKSRERGTYCRPIQQYGAAERAQQIAGADRYHMLNLTNLMGRGHGFQTVEIRAFAGTLNLSKIVGYISMSLGMVERAVKAKRMTNWAAKQPVETSPISRGGEGQTALNRFFYQMGWTKGRTAVVYGVVAVEGMPSVRKIKAVLMKMAAKYDGE